MQRFWEKIIEPILKELKPKHILEIGSQQGYNTVKILDFCEKYNSKLSSVDPFPLYDYEKLCKQYGNKFDIYRDLSLNVLAKIKNIDAVLIDGDHNWYTVYNELQLISKNCNGNFPLIFCHDVGWPYGRRDLYYNPNNIPPHFQQPFKRAGILLGQSELAETGGINDHLYNSIYENNNKNGVLTAIEDFIFDSSLELELYVFEGLNGLAILFERNKKNIEIFEKFDGIQFEISKLIERERIFNLIELEATRKKIKVQEGLNSQFQEELEKSKSLLNKKEQENSEYLNKINQLEPLLHEKERESSQYATKVSQLESFLQEKEQEHSEYITKVSQLESFLREKEQENSEYDTKVSQLESSLQAKEQENFEYATKVSQLESLIQEKERENSEYVAKVSQRESLLKEKEQEIFKYINKIKQLESALYEKEKNLSDYANKVEECKLIISNIKQMQSTAEESLQKVEKEKVDFIAEVKYLKKELDNSNKRINLLNEYLEIIKAEYTRLYMDNLYSFSTIVNKIKNYFK